MQMVLSSCDVMCPPKLLVGLFAQVDGASSCKNDSAVMAPGYWLMPVGIFCALPNPKMQLLRLSLLQAPR